MDIKGLDKAEVLAALYNRAKTQGMGILHYAPEMMSKGEAQKILDSGQTYFDYLKGRIMKIELESEEVETRLYNRDNGPDAAESVLTFLRGK